MSGILNKLHLGHKNQPAQPGMATVSGTDMNRDGIPDQLQQGGMMQPGMAQTTTVQQTTYQQGIQQPMVQTVVDAPIVQETIRQDRVIEVQPILHREVDKNVVHHIEKHIQEAPAPNMGGVVERAPLVEQHVVTNVINEIQPVIHRERVVPIVERQETHLAQRIVEPTIHTHEVVYERAPTTFINQQQGLAGQQYAGQQFQQGLATQPGMASMATVSGVDRNRDGIPDQLQQGGLNQGLAGQQGFNQGLAGQQRLPLGSDLNRDGIPDQLQRGPGSLPIGTDLNRDGIPDQLQRGGLGQQQQGLMGQQGLNQGLAGQQGFNQGLAGQQRLPLGSDLNRDGIPDQLQRGPGSLPIGTDLNRDGIPDQLQKGQQFQQPQQFQQAGGLQAGGLPQQQRF